MGDIGGSDGEESTTVVEERPAVRDSPPLSTWLSLGLSLVPGRPIRQAPIFTVVPFGTGITLDLCAKATEGGGGR